MHEVNLFGYVPRQLGHGMGAKFLKDNCILTTPTQQLKRGQILGGLRNFTKSKRFFQLRGDRFFSEAANQGWVVGSLRSASKSDQLLVATSKPAVFLAFSCCRLPRNLYDHRLGIPDLLKGHWNKISVLPANTRRLLSV